MLPDAPSMVKITGAWEHSQGGGYHDMLRHCFAHVGGYATERYKTEKENLKNGKTGFR